MKIKKLLHNKLLVKREVLPDQYQSESGLVLLKPKKELGYGFIEIGNSELKKGDKVVFNKYAGTDVDLQDRNEYVALDQRDILAKIEGGDDK